eukprot:6897424-Alexandrium_andersonii.AAC.1
MGSSLFATGGEEGLETQLSAGTACTCPNGAPRPPIDDPTTRKVPSKHCRATPALDHHKP